MKIMGGPYIVKEHEKEGDFEAEIFHVEMSAFEVEMLRKISGAPSNRMELPDPNALYTALRPLLSLTEAINNTKIALHYLRKAQEEGTDPPAHPRSGAV